MRPLATFAVVTCLVLCAAASCSGKDDATSVGGAAGVAGLASGGKPQAGASGVAAGGRGGDEISSGGTGGLDGAASSGGAAGIDGAAGSGGSNDEDPQLLPSHARTICDPNATYGSPLPTPANRTATRLSASYFFTEGPVWVASGGYLLFSDFYNAEVAPYVPGAHIRRFTPPNTFDTFITDSDSNGLALSADGLTLFATRRIKANVNDGEIASYAIATKAKATILGSPTNPNDLVARSDGNFYFSDGDVYRIAPNHDVATAVQVAAQSANGVMLSPDELTLYTGWSDGTVYASALTSEGSVSSPTPFATLQEGGHPDGMTVDCAGNLYAADYTNGIIQVFDNAGQHLGKIALPAAAAPPSAAHATNVAFGGANHRTLFITAHRGDWSDPAIGELHSIELNIPGLPY
jgi:gluconolactonase